MTNLLLTLTKSVSARAEESHRVLLGRNKRETSLESNRQLRQVDCRVQTRLLQMRRRERKEAEFEDDNNIDVNNEPSIDSMSRETSLRVVCSKAERGRGGKPSDVELTRLGHVLCVRASRRTSRRRLQDQDGRCPRSHSNPYIIPSCSQSIRLSVRRHEPDSSLMGRCRLRSGKIITYFKHIDANTY